MLFSLNVAATNEFVCMWAYGTDVKIVETVALSVPGHRVDDDFLHDWWFDYGCVATKNLSLLRYFTLVISLVYLYKLIRLIIFQKNMVVCAISA